MVQQKTVERQWLWCDWLCPDTFSYRWEKQVFNPQERIYGISGAAWQKIFICNKRPGPQWNCYVMGAEPISQKEKAALQSRLGLYAMENLGEDRGNA